MILSMVGTCTYGQGGTRARGVFMQITVIYIITSRPHAKCINLLRMASRRARGSECLKIGLVVRYEISDLFLSDDRRALLEKYCSLAFGALYM